MVAVVVCSTYLHLKCAQFLLGFDFQINLDYLLTQS